jgi:nitrous oxidase accessory protein NosD
MQMRFPRRPSSSGLPTRAARHRRRLMIEALEDRRLLASFSYSGTSLTIGLDAETRLSVTSGGSGNYVLSLSGTDRFSGTDSTGLTGNGLATLTVTNALSLTSVTINNSVDATAVEFAGSTGSYVDDFTVTLSRIASGLVPAADFKGNTAFAEAARLSVTAPTISLVSASVSTTTGSLTLAGDTGAAVASPLTGLTISGSTVATAGGELTLTGRGGNGDTGNLRGISIISGSTVKAGDTGSSFPTLNVTGRGGTSSTSGTGSDGVFIDATSSVQSTGSAVVINGTGGGANDGNRGITVLGTVAMGSVNPSPAVLALNGTGGGSGASAKDNAGVFVASTAKVSAGNGAIFITGTGGVGTTSTTAPYASSPGISLDSPTIAALNGPVTLKADSFTFGTSTSGLFTTNSNLNIHNAKADQVMRLNATAASQLTRVVAKDIVIGDPANLPVIEQDKAASGGAIKIGTPNLTVNGSAIRLRADVTNTGTQKWNGPVILGADADAADVQLTAAGITLANTVDGAKNLTLLPTNGPIRMEGLVGGTTPLASLRIGAASSVTAVKAIAIDGAATGARADGLTLDAGANGVDMQAAGSVIVNATGNGIRINGTTGSKISGFTLAKNALAGIHATGVNTGSSITGNVIEGGSKGAQGVLLDGTTGLALGTPTAGNTISGNSVGVLAKGTQTGTSIRSNAILANATGVSIQSATGLVVDANRLTGNTQYGMHASGVDTGTKLTRNTIRRSPFGIYIDGARRLTVGGAGQNNTIAAGTDAGGNYLPAFTSHGIFATGVLTGTTVVSNSIVDNTIGIQLTAARGLIVNGGNLLYRNRSHGIVVAGSSLSTTIQRNVIDGTLPDGTKAGYGIYLLNATQMLVGGSGLGNAIYSNTVGICATGSLSGSVVHGNSILNNVTGIVISSGTGLIVSTNDIGGSTSSGIVATGVNTSTTLTGNAIRHGANGVVLDGAQFMAVTANRIHTNRGVGLLARGVSTGTAATGNSITGNGVNIQTAAAVGGTFQRV